jgi:hypothetical protein
MNLPPPYDGKSSDYQAWKQRRLAAACKPSSMHFYPIDNANSASVTDNTDVLISLCEEVEQHGYAFYQFEDNAQLTAHAVRKSIARLHRSLGLTDADTGVLAGEDNLSLLKNSTDAAKRRFVPYSDRAMNWHTDGYYNAPNSSVRTFCLHCIEPAKSGGALTLLDDQLLLIALYDQNPEAVALLAHKEAMLVPESRDELGHARPDRLSAVFEVNHGRLLTRFTTRKHNIQWRTPTTKSAIEDATKLLNEQTQWQQVVRLEAGQGVVTRNILHCRSAFEDGVDMTGRQILRGRYGQNPSVKNATHTTTNRQS